MTYRWIMYVSQDIPGNQSFTLLRVASMTAARATYEKYCRDVMTDQCSARLYAYDAERWAEALEFRRLGCPFNYPDYIIERGTRGGVRVINA